MSLSEDCVAGIAIVSLNRTLAIGGLVLPIMTTEAAWPVLVPDVVGIGLPLSVHFREEIVRINLLNGIDDWFYAGLVGIALRKQRCDSAQPLQLIRVWPGKSEHGICFHPTKRRINASKVHREIHGPVRILI